MIGGGPDSQGSGGGSRPSKLRGEFALEILCCIICSISQRKPAGADSEGGRSLRPEDPAPAEVQQGSRSVPPEEYHREGVSAPRQPSGDIPEGSGSSATGQPLHVLRRGREPPQKIFFRGAPTIGRAAEDLGYRSSSWSAGHIFAAACHLPALCRFQKKSFLKFLLSKETDWIVPADEASSIFLCRRYAKSMPEPPATR